MRSTMTRLARILALSGGAVLFGLILLTCISVLGREFSSVLNGEFFQSNLPQVAEWLLAAGVGPVNGDFELVETGIAFAIFSFLPLCQLSASHATVDIFTSKMPDSVNRYLRMIADVAFAIVLVLIVWRLFEGTVSKYSTGETTFLLQFPVWWGYLCSLVAAFVGAIVGAYVAFVRINECRLSTDLLLYDPGADL